MLLEGSEVRTLTDICAKLGCTETERGLAERLRHRCFSEAFLPLSSFGKLRPSMRGVSHVSSVSSARRSLVCDF